RISNFLLWQTSYSELFFTPTLWPDFTSSELEEIIEKYHMVDRKFGGL
ncbi:MAG: undecaprenyl diphosphate synthase family protein, partial [Arcobacter sp.]|nr:undecaprenyl diphosphate synthase family protein [Arcobacter sp.]